MKKLLLMAAAIGLTVSLFAQNVVGSWKVKKYGISVGMDQDMISGLSHTYLMNTVKGSSDFQYENIPFGEEDLFSMTCENPNIRAEVTLLPPRMRNTELRLAVAGMFNRVDAVTFRVQDGQDYRSLSFDSYTNEIALEGALLKRLTILNTFNLYGGVGMNLGVSFDGSMYVDGQNLAVSENGAFGASDDAYVGDGFEMYDRFSDYYNIKNGLHQRAFVQAGFGLMIMRRLELGVDAKYGIGYRLIGGSAKQTNLNYAGFTAKWILK